MASTGAKGDTLALAVKRNGVGKEDTKGAALGPASPPPGQVPQQEAQKQVHQRLGVLQVQVEQL